MADDIREYQRPRRRLRGIYLLPNLFTLSGLFAGFYAIIAAAKGFYYIAAIAIFIAMIFDGLDGRIARLTHSTTEFGAHLDSMCDMMCFGVGPALVLYFWSLHVLGKAGWLVAFIYVACTALRLARFNMQLNDKHNKNYSQGLTTTMAAGLIASFVWVCSKYDISVTDKSTAVLIAIFAVLVAMLKVSTIRFNNFKNVNLRGRVPFVMIITITMLLLLIAFAPAEMLLLIFVVYVVSGPVMTLLGLFHYHRRKKNMLT